MKTDPVRLLDESSLPEFERSLLVAGQACPLVDYDVAAGVSRFRTTVAGLGAASVATTVASTARGATVVRGAIAKVAFKALLVVLVPVAGVGIAVAVHRARAKAPSSNAAQGTSATGAPTDRARLDEARATEPTPAANDAPEARVEQPQTSGNDTSGIEGTAVGRSTVDGRRALARARALRGGRGATDSPEPVPTEHVVLEETAETEGAGAEANRDPTATTTRSTATPADTRAPSSTTRAANDAQPAGQTDTATAHAEPPKPPAEKPKAASSSALEEMQAVVRARNLVGTDPNAALKALDDIRRQYPQGYFAEERRALTILALARVGNPGLARQQAARFLTQYPNSPFADKVRAAAQP